MLQVICQQNASLFTIIEHFALWDNILEMLVIGAYWNRYDIRENFLVLRRNSIHDLLQE